MAIRPRPEAVGIAGLVLTLGAGVPPRAQEVDPLARTAIDWIHLLRDGRFDEAAALVSPAARAQMGAEQLHGIWPRLQAQVGELVALRPGGRSEAGGYRIVDLVGEFGSGTFTVRVSFDAEDRVGGFFILPRGEGAVPGGDAPAWSPPGYVDPERYHEEEVTVGAPPWELPGTLTLPAGGGTSPAVVLVHGSGPQDRDETIGPTKPFRDLAWGLASRGVAVLRYEKRTLVHRGRMEVDLDSEVVDDALAAVELLRARPEVEPGAVFVLGHSLGGTLAPEIARRDAGLAGVVVLAGSTRPFSVVVRAQLLYLRGLPENSAPEARSRIDSLLAIVDRYRAGELDENASLMGAPLSYVRELDRVDPVGVLASIDTPALLLQGRRDYQVTEEEDFAAWRRGLADRPATRFIVYPDLSHLFTPGQGMATPLEYATRPGHVAGRVVEDVAAWIGTIAR